MKRVKSLVTVLGATYGEPNGIKRGQVVDLSDFEADRMIAAGQAQANWRDDAGPAYAEQSATVQTSGTRRVWDGWRA